MAKTRRSDADENLTRPRRRQFHFFQAQRSAELLQDGGFDFHNRSSNWIGPEFPFCFSVANQYTPSCVRSPSFLHPFQRQSPERARLGRLWNQRAMICPISKHLVGHLPRELPSSVQIGFASLPRLPGWQRQSLHAPQHASEQAPRHMAFCQQQPVVASMFDQPPARLHQPLLQTCQ